MNGQTNMRLQYWANYLFFMVPLLAATYIALVLVPEASARWPARFISWQELSLLMLVILFSFASARPLCRLRQHTLGPRAGLNGIAAVLSLFAMVGGAAALMLQTSRWIVGAFLIAAALPPLVRGLAGCGRDELGRRFNM